MLICPSPIGIVWTWTFCIGQVLQPVFRLCLAFIFTSLYSIVGVLTSIHPISWEVLSTYWRNFPALSSRVVNLDGTNAIEKCTSQKKGLTHLCSSVLLFQVHIAIRMEIVNSKLHDGGIMAALEVGKRLAMLMKNMKLKNYQFAKKFNISAASLSRYKSGERYPDPELLLRLSEAEINVNWLLTGKGTTQIVKDFDGWMKERLEEKLKVVDSRTGLIQAPTIDYTRTINLQMLGEISAGPREHIEDLRHLGETIEVPRTLLPGNFNNYLAFRVNGRSMEPNIMHEDIVVIKQEYDWDLASEKVCAIRADDGTTLKKVELDPANRRIILQPFNLDCKVQILDPDQGLDVNLIGVLSLQLRLF